MTDKVKLGLAILLLIGGVAGFYFLGAQSIWLRTAVVVGGVVLAALVALASESGRAFRIFAGEAVAETRKVVWPTRKETTQMTLAVVASVILVSIFLWIVDSSLGFLVSKIFSKGA